MTLARLEAGSAAQDTDVDLAEVVRSAVADVVPQALEKGQRIDFRPVIHAMCAATRPAGRAGAQSGR